MKAVVIRNWRSAITLGLILWCAGAGCMLVSVAQGAARCEAADTKTSAANTGWGQVSGSAGAHDCCKARHASERRAAPLVVAHVLTPESSANLEGLAGLMNSSDAMSCCPLTSGTIIATGRQRITNDDASVSRGLDAATVVTSGTATPPAAPLRLLNQSQTYLRSCAFLI
jgi:hypothetical protein